MTLIEEIRSDMSLKNGSLSGAMLSFFLSLMMFIAVPYAVFVFASGSLDGGITIFGNVNGLADGVWGWVMNMMKYSVPLILLSVPIGFYRAGSYSRVPFRILFALYLGTWLWIASGGGIFSFPLTGDASSAVISLDVRYVAYVIIMISFAMIFLAFSELGGNRKKYLEALDRKRDTMSERKARRLSG